MTAAEFAPIVKAMIGRWPNVNWAKWRADGVLDQYLADLADVEAGQVASAVAVLARDGREFPPTAGQIRRRAVELALDAPAWSDCKQVVRRAMGYSSRAFIRGEFHDERQARLEREHPLIVGFVEHVGWDEAGRVLSGESSDEAQVRVKWEQWVDHHVEGGTLAGLPDAGLKRLERANREPRPLADVLAQLGSGQ